MTIAAYDRRRKSARWLAFGYIIGMSNFLIEFGIATFGASACRGGRSPLQLLPGRHGRIQCRHRAQIRRAGALAHHGLLIAVSVAVCYSIQDMPRQSFTRMLLYQAPYVVMQAIAVGIVGRARNRSTLDNVLMALLAASALQFLCEAVPVPGFRRHRGDSPQDYLKTNYALFSQSMGTIFAMAIALMLLVILVRDVLADATARSETDTLSGLLNRGGFEARAAEALRGARGGTACRCRW